MGVGEGVGVETVEVGDGVGEDTVTGGAVVIVSATDAATVLPTRVCSKCNSRLFHHLHWVG